MALLTRRGIGAAAVALLMATPALAAATADPGGRVAQEYDLKAVFLVNFARFVEWPPDAFATPDTPITVCILGEDPFGPGLDEIFEDEFVGRRSVVRRRCRDATEARNCHVLFISDSEMKRLESIVSQLSGKSILTVGESDGFAKRNGMIRFVMAGNRLRLRINVDAAKAAKLTISSKLLRQAEIVRSGSDR